MDLNGLIIMISLSSRTSALELKRSLSKRVLKGKWAIIENPLSAGSEKIEHNTDYFHWSFQIGLRDVTHSFNIYIWWGYIEITQHYNEL